MENDFEFNKENIEFLQTNYALLDKIYKTYNEVGEGIIDENFSYIESLTKKFKWGLDAYAMISSNPNINEIKLINLTYNELFVNKEKEKEANTISIKNKPFLNEINLITTYINAFMNWQKSTKDMLNDHVKRKKEGEKVTKELDLRIKKEMGR